MEVRLVFLVCFFVVVQVARSMNVKSKPGEFEDTYGDSADGPAEDVQNDFEDYGIDDGGDEEGDARNDPTPEFRSKSQVFHGQIGDVIELPCEITNSEVVVVVWRKNDNELLYQGDVPVKEFPNIRKTNDGLKINITSEKDFAQYSCQMMISTDNSPMIVHTISPPGPPKILAIRVSNNKTVYMVGETLELSCLATGYPKPKISWHVGSQRIEPAGENITIPNLKPHNSGVYRCLADNNILPPAHSHIEINVEHKPVVSIDKYIVNSNNEKDAELKCTVHAYPPAIVVWQKDHKNIKSVPSKIELKRHNNMNNVDYVLMIYNVTEEDFGQYTCSATNQFDKVEKSVSLVKVPVMQGFVKPEKTSKDVVLSWNVESKSPITDHQLQYRRKGESEWRNVKPEVKYDGNDVSTVSYTLKGLEPGSYETRARSQNAHGWSEYSEIMPFEGVLAKNGHHHKSHRKHNKEQETKEKQASHPTQPTPTHHQESDPTVIASQTGGSASATASVCLTSIALLALRLRQ